MYLATKFIPQKRVNQALLEEGHIHAAMAKTEDCRKTLKAVKAALETNWENNIINMWDIVKRKLRDARPTLWMSLRLLLKHPGPPSHLSSATG
ncbi:hypothetical protein UPYG_G00024940 [Umbra pygmaea]|uniref:Uncharacterized protein n=1 Tax=Umbra pygmaea TaxID=75934 RepID=A0ABD0Y8S6_UMBPY